MKYLDSFKSIKSFIDKNIFIISIALIFILFHPFFENLISKLFVDTFFCKLRPSIINDLIFVGVLFFVFYRFINNLKNNFFISNKSTLITILLLVIGMYYRFFDNIWIFTSTWVSNYLKYFDIVLFFFISNIIIRVNYKEKKLSVSSELGFCFDNPNKDPNKALKNRIIIAEKIAEKIKNTSDPDSSFAIGITSEWGRGKTSFINLIESKINDNEKRIIVHFNPWLNNDEKSLIKSFFDELSIPLKKYNRELSDDLLKYAELLSSVDENGFSKFYKGFEYVFSNKNDDLKSRFENINRAILASGLQIIISIDDLDRLFEKEIVEVLRLIRNSANFANTIFIVAYDRNYLVSSLKKANDYKPAFYLEKIFQLEIALPPFEKSVIIEQLKELFIEKLVPTDQQEFQKLLISKNGLFDSHGFRHDLITNLRDINRLANSFFISYESLKGEIVLADLLNVELLRSKYLGVYNLLASDYQSYLTTARGKTDDYMDVAYLRLDKENDDAGKETDIIKLKRHLETNFTEVGIQENQIEDVIKYVCAVFPFRNQYSRIKSELTSITNPTSIDRYFHYNLLGSNLSEVEFSKFRQGLDEMFFSKINEWVDKGLKNELNSRFERLKFYSSKEDYEKIIKSIFHFASISNGIDTRFLGFDNRNLLDKLNYKNVSHFYTEDEFMTFVENVFKNQKPPYIYVSEFIKFIFDDIRVGLNEWTFIVKMEWLIECKLNFFKLYAESIDKIDVYLFWLYHDCSYKRWERINNSTQIKPIEDISDEAKDIFKKCAKRLIENFIKNTITRYSSNYSDGKELYSILNTVRDIWGNWDDFELFLLDLDENQVSGLNEFLDFFSKCREVNFEKYVEYDFHDIDLSDALLLNN